MLKMKNKSQPPGPRPHPFVGHLVEMTRDPLNFFSKAAHDYGEITLLYMPFGSVYLLSNPAHIEQVLLTQRRNFLKARPSRLFVRVFGNGLTFSDGEFWLHQRRLIQPAFHKERITSYVEVMTTIAENFISHWQATQVRNLQEDFIALSQEIVSKILFSTDLATEAEEAGVLIDQMLKEMAKRLARPFDIPASIPTPGNRRYYQSLNQLDTTIYSVIKKRQAMPGQHDLLTLLIEAVDENDQHMSDRQIRDEIMSLFLGGHETIADNLTWIWYLLTDNPRVLAKLEEEVEICLKGQSPKAEDLRSLHYLDMIIKESLRLYPTNWFLTRKAVTNFEMGGYLIKSGQLVGLSPWVMHHSPIYFDKPELFLPERWENDAQKQLPKYVYLPFGGGPHMCIGNIFALTEISIVLALMVQRFRYHRIENHPPIVARPAGTLRLGPCLKVVVEAR